MSTQNTIDTGIRLDSIVDPKLVDMSSIDDETRYKIFDYLWSQKRISSRDIGISPSLANKIKNKKVRISDSVLEKLLQHLTLEEFTRLTGKHIIEKVEPHTVVQVLKAALADLALRHIAIDIVLREVGAEIYEYPRMYRVTEEDIEKFKKILSEKARRTDNATYTGL